eukprot:2337554-Pleurochrysis_carterae.AAC.1
MQTQVCHSRSTCARHWQDASCIDGMRRYVPPVKVEPALRLRARASRQNSRRRARDGTPRPPSAPWPVHTRTPKQRQTRHAQHSVQSFKQPAVHPKSRAASDVLLHEMKGMLYETLRIRGCAETLGCSGKAVPLPCEAWTRWPMPSAFCSEGRASSLAFGDVVASASARCGARVARLPQPLAHVVARRLQRRQVEARQRARRGAAARQRLKRICARDGAEGAQQARIWRARTSCK